MCSVARGNFFQINMDRPINLHFEILFKVACSLLNMMQPLIFISHMYRNMDAIYFRLIIR